MPRLPLFLATLSTLAFLAPEALANCAATAGQIAAIVIPARVPGAIVRSGQAEVPVGYLTREAVTLDRGTWWLAAVPCPLGRTVEVRLESASGSVVCSGRSSGSPSQALIRTSGGIRVDTDLYPLASTACAVSGGSYEVVVEMISGEPGSSTAWQIRR